MGNIALMSDSRTYAKGMIVIVGLQGYFAKKLRTLMLNTDRKFLFLQGPHGPFFGRVAENLKRAGCSVMRVGFTRGDRFFWPKNLPYQPYQGDEDGWAEALGALIATHGLTDIVLYGDCRPLHAIAVKTAKAQGLVVHVFEEGYLRPYWATYERDGSNGNSALMHIELPEMQAALDGAPRLSSDAPAQWGPIWHHIWYGMLYHFNLILPAGPYKNYRPHRNSTLWQELRLHSLRLLGMPRVSLQRRFQTRKLLRRGEPYFIVLLQLGHDSSIISHSDFSSVAEFAKLCIENFAEAGQGHHRLVFKTHPLEDGREGLSRKIKEMAEQAGVADRVDFIIGGKLGQLLDNALGAVTINSTAAQQAFWRGLPVRALGRSIFDKDELVSRQNLVDFFKNPVAPNRKYYHDYREYLLQTSQVPGGYYTVQGRAGLTRRVVDMMLAKDDPYQALMRTSVTQKHLKVVD